MSEDGHLKNVSEDGQVPSTRVTSARAAMDIARNIIDNNRHRNRRNALVQGLIDGNPPYSREKLKGSGQAYRSNFNDNQALAVQEAGMTAYYDLFSEVPHWATVMPDTGDQATDIELGRVITTEFQKLQNQDDYFEDLINLSHHDLVTYGSGPIRFPRDDDWTCLPVKHDDFMLDNNEPSDMNRWTKVLIREHMTVSQLMQYISDPEAAQTMGWDVANVRQSIQRASQHTRRQSTNTEDWQKIQSNIRQNDLQYTGPDKEVEVGILLFEEFPRKGEPSKISEVWIDLSRINDKGEKERSKAGFLYRGERKYDEWRNVVNAMMINRGTGKFHSIKGIGVRMYGVLMNKLRLDNAVNDAAFFMASIHARKKTPGPTGAESIVYKGPLTLWRADYEPMNHTNAAAGIEAASAVSQQMDNKLQGNLSQFRPDPNKPLGNPRTATEVAAIVQQQSVLTKTAISKYFRQLDWLYEERFRRAALGPLNSMTKSAKAAREFRRKLAARGITPEILKTCTVMATRTVGQGSHFLRQQTLTNLWSLTAGTLPEGGKDALLDDVIASHAGYSMVERYNPRNRFAVKEQDHAWDAHMENSAVMTGGEIMITDTQDGFIHAVIHQQALQQGLQSIGQGTDPVKIAMFGQEIRPHIEGHLQTITDDPTRQDKVKALIESLKVTFNQLDDLTQTLQQQQQAQMQEAGNRQQAESQMSMDAAKTQQDMLQKQATHAQMIRQAEERHTQQMQINREQADSQLQQKKLTNS